MRQHQGSDEPLSNPWPLSSNRWHGLLQEVDEESWKLLMEAWAESRGNRRVSGKKRPSYFWAPQGLETEAGVKAF